MAYQDVQRRAADALPPDDIVAVIRDQHADISDLLEQLENSAGDQRRQSFAALSALLRSRASARPAIPRATLGEVPASMSQGDPILALLASMSTLDVDSLEFSDLSEALVALVWSDLAQEDHSELPALERLPGDERLRLGARFLAASQEASARE